MPEKSLESLYLDTIDQVFGYVYSRVRNRELAEDIVSEAYVKVAEHYDRFVTREHASARSWVFTIARNVMNDHFRRPATTELVDEHSSQTQMPDVAVDINLAHADVMKALEKLPDRQQEILLLRFKGELRNHEIAEQLNIAERSVSAALSKAITTLRQILYV
jgi:RNA polymerase sigma-70 factor (ECF subfamily)